MDIMIQDPTYASSMRLGEALIDACKKSSDGAGAFAFAEENGIDLFLGDVDFSNYIKTNKYELVIGTDSITDPKSIARLRTYCKLYSNLTVYGYVHDPRKYLFHPKLTWFETSTGGLSIIGSGNLTERGLYHNVEMYAYNALDAVDFAKLKDDWEDWLNYSIANNLVFDIGDPIIDHAVNLSASKKVRAFTGTTSAPGTSGTTGTTGTAITPQLSALYKTQPGTISIKKPSTPAVPKTTKTKTKPKKATSVIATPIPAVAPVVVAPSTSPVWTVTLTDRVLIAEVPKASARWKQINFDKASFQNYFGATPGGAGGTYRILLKNVDSAGVLGTTEPRPSVSVASHNWRFEISAARGIPYPAGVNRPYVVFSEASTRSFLYELVMPGDPRYVEVDNYVNAWKRVNGVTGIARIITDVNSLQPTTPSLGLWKV